MKLRKRTPVLEVAPSTSLPKKPRIEKSLSGSKTDNEKSPVPEFKRLNFNVELFTNELRKLDDTNEHIDLSALMHAFEKILTHAALNNRSVQAKLHHMNHTESFSPRAVPQYECESDDILLNMADDTFNNSVGGLPVESYDEEDFSTWPPTEKIGCFWIWCKKFFMHDVTADHLKAFKTYLVDPFFGDFFFSPPVNEPLAHMMPEKNLSRRDRFTPNGPHPYDIDKNEFERISSSSIYDDVEDCVEHLLGVVCSEVQNDKERPSSGSCSKDMSADKNDHSLDGSYHTCGGGTDILAKESSNVSSMSAKSSTGNEERNVCEDYVAKPFSFPNLSDAASTSRQISQGPVTDVESSNISDDEEEFDISCYVKNSFLNRLARKGVVVKGVDSEQDEVSAALIECEEQLSEIQPKLRSLVESTWLKLKSDFAHHYTERKLNDADRELFNVFPGFYHDHPKRRPSQDEWPIIDAAMKRRNKMARLYYGKEYKRLGYYAREQLAEEI